jgi:hypothetical protein
VCHPRREQRLTAFQDLGREGVVPRLRVAETEERAIGMRQVE